MTPARTVRTEVTRVLDLGSEAGEDPDLRVRKRTAVASAFVLMSVAVVIGVVDAFTSDAISAILAALQITVFGSALLVFHRTHRLAPLIVTMATVGMAIVFLSLIPTGGLTTSGLTLIWIILVPLVSVLFLGLHAARHRGQGARNDADIRARPGRGSRGAILMGSRGQERDRVLRHLVKVRAGTPPVGDAARRCSTRR